MEWFTNGEWMVVCGAGVDDEIGVGMGSYLENPDDYYTNHLWTCDIQPCDADKECMANAHLIAASPEMYELLKRIIDMNLVKAVMTQNDIVNVLAKARGEK